MRTPRLLMGAGLVFWGWQTGLLWVGVAAALILESASLCRVRWAFSQSDLDRVWNLCVALFLGGTIYAFFSGENLSVMGDLLRDNSPSSRLATLNQSKRSFFQLLELLPLVFLPIALAQVFGEQEQLDLSTFSWWLRRQRGAPDYATRYAYRMDIRFPYFACCIFAACAAAQRSVWFTLALVVLIIWPLWLSRPRLFRSGAWILSLVLALLVGVGLHLGMLEAQKLIQRLDEVLIARWSASRSTHSKQTETRIGSIGSLKLSGRIVLRVDPQGQAPPPLLREASYNLFHAPVWMVSDNTFERVPAQGNQTSWVLAPEDSAARTVVVAGALPYGTGLLALPTGVTRLEKLPVLELNTNAFGAVRADDGPGFIECQAGYGEPGAIDSPPLPEDRDVPPYEQPAIRKIAAQLQLDSREPRQAVRLVERFFAEHFSYSVWQGPVHRTRPQQSALAHFLLETRSGHCEYFATATTLLLRAADIPARYAVGYAVQEKRGRYYIVRERHAHAWCLAWIDGAWRNVDTTPATWSALESQRASVWEPIRDAFSWLQFQFSRWRWGHAAWKQYLLWLVGPVLALALARILLQRQWSRSRSAHPDGRSRPAWPGLDSEFYAIESRLAQAGLGRNAGETGLAWLRRLRQAGSVPVDELEPLLMAHYRLRFDPHGLDAAERLQLRRQAGEWVSRYQQSFDPQLFMRKKDSPIPDQVQAPLLPKSS